MADSFDPVTRSRIMAKVRSADTSPELALRKALFRLGFRYRLHCAALPGKPDLVFPRYHAVVFINGCFWHWHGCRRSRMPATNAAYWQSKIGRNQRRDTEIRGKLFSAGWRVLVVWECALKKRLVGEAAQLSAAWLRGENVFSIIEPAEKTGAESALQRISPA